MAVMSLVVVVAPRTGKIIKNGLSVCMVYYTLCLDSVNRQESHWKVRNSRRKTDFSEKG